MRRFFSYGPVEEKKHFTVPRKKLIQTFTESLVGDSEEAKHFFTIWAPRQTGKTWLVRQVKKTIEKKHSDRFAIGMMSMQGVAMGPDEQETAFLQRVPLLFWEAFRAELPKAPANIEDFKNLFLKDKGIFKKLL